jgi:hypothetical protein
MWSPERMYGANAGTYPSRRHDVSISSVAPPAAVIAARRGPAIPPIGSPIPKHHHPLDGRKRPALHGNSREGPHNRSAGRIEQCSSPHIEGQEALQLIESCRPL